LKRRLLQTCSQCNGTGAEPGTSVTSCPDCHGTGEISAIRQTLLGQIRTTQSCPHCSGSGRVVKTKCSQCRGKSREYVEKKLNIKIPAGVLNGSTLKIANEGDNGINGGKTGDLYINIQVQAHEYFQRDNYDVLLDQKIHVLQSILGDNIEVPTLHGPIALKIPAGTSHDQTFRLKSYGIPKLNKEGRGDQYVTIKVVIPHKLSSKEKSLYEEVAKESGLNLDGKTKDQGFLKKILGY